MSYSTQNMYAPISRGSTDSTGSGTSSEASSGALCLQNSPMRVNQGGVQIVYEHGGFVSPTNRRRSTPALPSSTQSSPLTTRRDNNVCASGPASGSPQHGRQSTRANNTGITNSSVASETDSGSPVKHMSVSAARLAPHMLVPSLRQHHRIPQTLFEIPEEYTVREFAYRAGQKDRGNGRKGRIPNNPFAPELTAVWKAEYQRGKYSTAPTVSGPSNPPSPSRENSDWAPLINTYTQTPEYPKGIYDVRYIRKTIESALTGMEMIIIRIKERGKDWDRLVADMPVRLVRAAEDFPDLSKRYHDLRYKAAQAKASRVGRHTNYY